VGREGRPGPWGNHTTSPDEMHARSRSGVYQLFLALAVLARFSHGLRFPSAPKESRRLNSRTKTPVPKINGTLAAAEQPNPVTRSGGGNPPPIASVRPAG